MHATFSQLLAECCVYLLTLVREMTLLSSYSLFLSRHSSSGAGVCQWCVIQARRVK